MPTSSQLDVRLGAQEPVISHLPPGVVSLAAAEEAIELADAYGVADGHPLAESQKITLRAGLGERADGSWAATRIADFGPRQGTGKNDKIAARELAGLILFGERLIIHTAHEFPTANESFLRLVAVFEAWDDLRRKVARIRYANGEQGIELLTGQRLKYRARTGGSGRGFAKADLVVYDEAQHLGREHVAASGPAKLANPNSQTWYAGSGGLVSSGVAWAIRRAALLGSGGRLAYTEMTAESITVAGGRISTVVPDPTDRDVWYRCIPGLGRWVTEEGVEALYDELGAELFLREVLCVWDPEPGMEGEWVIPSDDWAHCEDPDSQIASEKPAAFTLDVSPDQRSAAFAVAGKRSDGLTHVEVIEHRSGIQWVVARAVEIQQRWGCELRLDSAGPAGALLEDLATAKVKVREVTSREHTQACGAFYAAVTAEESTVRHIGQPELMKALSGAAKFPVGDAWKWSRKNSAVDIAPLVAVTLAFGIATTKASTFAY